MSWVFEFFQDKVDNKVKSYNIFVTKHMFFIFIIFLFRKKCENKLIIPWYSTSFILSVCLTKYIFLFVCLFVCLPACLFSLVVGRGLFDRCSLGPFLGSLLPQYVDSLFCMSYAWKKIDDHNSGISEHVIKESKKKTALSVHIYIYVL